MSKADCEILGQTKAEIDFKCGEKLFIQPHVLDKIVFVREAVTCGMPVEKPYYSKTAATKYPSLCCWCVDSDATNLINVGEVETHGAKILPICRDCVKGQELVKCGKEKKTKQAKEKGSKRRKRAAAEEEEEDEEEEDEDEEEESDDMEAEAEEEDEDEDEEDGDEQEGKQQEEDDDDQEEEIDEMDTGEGKEDEDEEDPTTEKGIQKIVEKLLRGGSLGNYTQLMLDIDFKDVKRALKDKGVN